MTPKVSANERRLAKLLAVPERDVEVAVLRKLLFLHHHKGCYLKGSYTDDGELQCHGCGVDFRRIDVVELERQWMMKGLASLAAPEPQGYVTPASFEASQAQITPTTPPTCRGCGRVGFVHFVPNERGTLERRGWMHHDDDTPLCVAPERPALDRETLARALCDESYWGGFSERTRDQWRIHADAILARLAEKVRSL